MKSIEIDFDVHKMIENERNGFDETENTALRRLLGLADLVTTKNTGTTAHNERPFIEDGAEVPHGSKAQMSYLRGTQYFKGEFLNGVLIVNGKEYHSLSGAACDLARTAKGTKTQLNGWLYWEFKPPGSNKWRKVAELRKSTDL